MLNQSAVIVGAYATFLYRPREASSLQGIQGKSHLSKLGAVSPVGKKRTCLGRAFDCLQTRTGASEQDERLQRIRHLDLGSSIAVSSLRWHEPMVMMSPKVSEGMCASIGGTPSCCSVLCHMGRVQWTSRTATLKCPCNDDCPSILMD
jgi:hypothetical protein